MRFVSCETTINEQFATLFRLMNLVGIVNVDAIPPKFIRNVSVSLSLFLKGSAKYLNFPPFIQPSFEASHMKKSLRYVLVPMD